MTSPTDEPELNTAYVVVISTYILLSIFV